MAINFSLAAKELTPLSALIADLSNDEGWVRQQARRALVRQGADAVPQLLDAFSARDERTRLEVAKVLRQIADPRTATALVLALEDSESGVRWLAMDGLIALGRGGLPALLHALVERSDSVILREGAHRIIREGVVHVLLRPILMPVLRALEGVEPSVTLPAAAQTALRQLSDLTSLPDLPINIRHMRVGDWMSAPPFTVEPHTTLADAYRLMQTRHIRRLPVVQRGRLVGILTHGDVREAKPSDATTLSIYEMNYRWATLTVEQVMTTTVLTTTPDATLVSAAQLMLGRKIGGLPVMEDNHVVGILTESDIFRAFIEEETVR